MFINAEKIAKRIERQESTTEDLFLFLIAFFKENRTGPVMREMCLAIDIIQGKKHRTSKSTIAPQLKNLEREGKIILPRGINSRTPGRMIIVNSEWKYHGEPTR